MQITKVVLLSLALSTALANSPQMPHTLGESPDETVLEHFNTATRYTHTFDNSDEKKNSQVTECGDLFGIAKEQVAGLIEKSESLKDVKDMLAAGAEFSTNECRANTEGFTWVLLRIEHDYKVCDIHVPINLANYANNGENILNEHYAYKAIELGHSKCESSPKLVEKVIEDLKKSPAEEVDTKTGYVTKVQRIRKEKVNGDLKKTAALFDENKEQLDEQVAAEIKEEIERIQEEQKDDLTPAKTEELLEDIKDLAEEIKEKVGEETEAINEDKEEDLDENKASEDALNEHLTRVAEFWSQFGDDTNESEKPAPKNGKKGKRVSFAGLKPEKPHKLMAVEKKMVGAAITCGDDHKETIIGLIYAQATAKAVPAFEMYTENINECFVALRGGVQYDAIVRLNEEECYYGVSVNAGTGDIRSTENPDVKQGVLSCKTVMGL